MEIKKSKENGINIITIEGRLDANTSGELEKTLIPMIEGGAKKIIVDFSRLDYISSAGLRLLLLAAKKLKKINGKIILCSMKDFIKEIFDISGFIPIFTITESKEEGIKKLK